MTTTLSTRLRDETKQAHTRAERSGIMRALLSGQLSVDGYAALQANLHTIYVALEDSLQAHADHPAVAAIYDPALNRADRLSQDLTLLAGADWPARVPVCSAAGEYRDRILTVSREAPGRLVAHSYTRYLGDLSGGQILLRFAAKILPPELQGATAFYEFPTISDPDSYKRDYRAALDALGSDDAQLSDEIVAEALLAFDLNAKLFEALQ